MPVPSSPPWSLVVHGGSGIIERRLLSPEQDAAARAGLGALGGPEGGGTVLLAPIGTSFDLFRDYRARGESFARAARTLAAGEVTA